MARAARLASVTGRCGPEAAAQDADHVPTYTADVAPILFGHCVSCHRPGQVEADNHYTVNLVRELCSLPRALALDSLDLRGGVYTVTFTFGGFATGKREAYD